MNYNDFCKQVDLRRRKPDYKNSLIAEEIIDKYLRTINQNTLSHQTGIPIEDLLYEYFSQKGTENENILIELLNSYNFNYSMSIHNAIYNLLSEDNDVFDPLLWPGIIDINIQGDKYILKTFLGTIEVYQASRVFSDSKSSFVFSKTLAGKCYERTYDFLKVNNDYKAILSYMPNFFYGGHYHAYLEKDGTTLDIASNAIYYNQDSASKILCGEILAKLTYSQVKRKFNTIRNTVPNVNPQTKLLTLALYYDKKKH